MTYPTTIPFFLVAQPARSHSAKEVMLLTKEKSDDLPKFYSRVSRRAAGL
jgi:hypothetical protein